MCALKNVLNINESRIKWIVIKMNVIEKAMFNIKSSLPMHRVPILYNINKYSNIVAGGDSIICVAPGI